MPTEENQNVQTGGNPSTGDQSNTDNAVDNNIDIDLNLDGVDIDVEKKSGEKEEVKPEENILDDGDDRLVQEDKKVEELQQDVDVEKKPEEVIANDTDKIPVDTVESLMDVSVEEKKIEEINIDVKEEKTKENAEENSLDDLDIPVVVDTNESNTGDEKLEELEELKPIVDEEKAEAKAKEEIKEEVEVKEKIKEENIKEDVVEETTLEDLDLGVVEKEKPQEELHTEDLGEVVVENKEGDIVSDTGDMNSEKDGYIPNEHDFNQVTDALNSKEQGSIDLGSLEEKNDVSSDLKEGVDLNKGNETSGAMDLDSMIANMGAETNNLLETADASKTIENTVVEKEVEAKVIPEIMPETKPTQIDLGSISDTAVNNVEQVAPVTEKTNNIVAPGAVILSEDPTKKNKHTGLKVFVLIIVLLVLGVVILSKMYPEEFGDIMSAVKGEDTTVIEYSDNADSGVVLEETQDIDVNLTGNVEEVEELDPDSLAGQLENNNDSGNTMEYSQNTGEVVEESGHNSDISGEDEFNAFGGLEDVMDPVTSENADLLAELRKYQAKGKEFDAWGREIGNTTAMKYGLYISEKAETVINDIETNVKIDNTKVENYFAQFDIYLTKLEKLRVSIDGEVQDDALVSSGTDEQTTTSTGTVQ